MSPSRDDRTAEDTLEIPLEQARWRHATWGAVGILLGVFLIVRVTSVIFRGLGVLVLLGGLKAGRAFVRTLFHAPGTIVLGDAELVLPPRIHAAAPVRLPLGDVKYAYLLRRSVPWTTAGPVLVVETRVGTFEFPRDWFPGDGDQRRLATALNRKLGKI